MAIAVQMDFVGATLQQYDEVVREMGLTPQGQGAPGGISHFVTKTDDGIRIIDVWRSKEQFEQFADAQIGPLAKQAGITNPPKLQYFEVHSYLTPGD